jgi:N-acetylmuramoyl-L-alanine amidase
MHAVNVEDRLASADPDILLLHYTGMDDAERACRWLCTEESRVSCHYLVDEAGQITQMVSEDKRAWHAGVSSWQGAIDVNSRSIGIEIQNPGHNAGYPAFPFSQMQVVAALARDIIARWKIKPKSVLAHSDVAPGRKIDPGEKFDWHYLYRQGVGQWVRPEPVSNDVELDVGTYGTEVSNIQCLLKTYGYNVEITRNYCIATKKSVEAFQRHFRQMKVDGVADVSTIVTLRRLVDS